MSQYTINIGAIPNDGTGDPLRTAFNETNLNFDQVFAAGPVLSNVRIANNTILTTTTNGNLVLAPNGIGRIQANATIVPSVANVRDLGSATQRWNTVYTQYLNLSGVLTTGDLIVDGNLTVQGNTIQIGNIVTDTKTIQLANTAGTANAANGSGITVGANDAIATFLYTSAENRWNTNIGLQVAGPANVAILSVNQTANAWRIAGNILTAPSGASWSSNPEFLDEYITSAPDGYIDVQSILAGNTAAALHLEHGLAQIIANSGTTQTWTFDSTGNLTLPSNIASINYANGNPYGGSGGSYGNANVATFLAAFGSNTISTTGNITSNGLVNVNTLRVNQTANAWVIASNTISAPSGATWNSNPEFLDEYITSAPDGYINLTSLYANGNTASQIHLEHGLAQIVVDNGSSYIWEFDDSGNLTLPGNTFAVNYANGNPVTINSSSYGNANVATFLSNFGSNTISTTGAVNTGNLFITGNILANSAGNVWSISNDFLSFPSGASWQSNKFSLDEYISSAIDGYLNLQTFDNTSNVATELHMEHGVVQINIYNGSLKTWNFNEDGSTTFPGDLLPTANLGGSLGNSSLYWSNLWVANNTIYIGGVALGMTAGNVLTVDGNAVLTNGSNTAVSTTGNITAGNIGITGGSLTWANASIVQTSASDVSITGDGQVTVRSLDGTYQWTFESTGNLTLPGATAGETIATQGGYITVGNLLVGQGGALFNSNNDSWALYGNLSDPGATILIPSNADAGNGTPLYIESQQSNVEIRSGSSTWNFDTTGNLTLPGNTFAVNYANGGPVTFTANTGNVTFSGETVIGTGTSNTVSGLYLAPDSVSLTNDLYLRVRGNILDEPTHIHFDTGNNQYYNQFIGDDNKYVQLANTGNIIINTSDYVGNTAQWTFGTDSNLTTPGGMIINGNINTLGSQTALLQPTDDLPLAFIASGANGSVISYWAEDIANLMSSNIAAIYTPLQNTQTVRIVTGTNGGNIAIYDFDKNGVFTTTQVSATGNVTGNYFIGNGSLLTGISAGLPVANGTSNINIATANGNATITANAVTYTFGTDSTLTLPGGSRLRPLGANLDIFAGTGSYVNLITSDESSSMGVAGAGGYVTTAGGTWNFNTNGNLTAPGNISAVGNVTSGNLTVGSGTITGGNVNGAVFNGNVAFGTGTVGGSGNITGGNLITTGSGGDITMTGGNITGVGNISAGNVSATGNVTAANFFGNGNTLSNVATQVTGSWTVPVGNSTQSFTVSNIGTYSMWVDCNITNGILAWNATATVTNNNVPVVGAQYAWVYNGGGTPIDFTSIPNQFTGTANTIVRSSVAPSATTNRFDFGINNTSGNAVTVRYGYTKIS
jgi:hypothetical protein